MEIESKEKNLNSPKNSSKPLKSDNSNSSSKNATCFIDKCSIFDFKHSEKLLNKIVEVVEGFQHDFDLNADKQTKKLRQSNNQHSLESVLSKNLSVSDKLFCTSCNYTLTDRDEQV
jgi:hypothetical protein